MEPRAILIPVKLNAMDSYWLWRSQNFQKGMGMEYFSVRKTTFSVWTNFKKKAWKEIHPSTPLATLPLDTAHLASYTSEKFHKLIKTSILQ
jgi:hypothetical protein